MLPSPIREEWQGCFFIETSAYVKRDPPPLSMKPNGLKSLITRKIHAHLFIAVAKEHSKHWAAGRSGKGTNSKNWSHQTSKASLPLLFTLSKIGTLSSCGPLSTSIKKVLRCFCLSILTYKKILTQDCVIIIIICSCVHILYPPSFFLLGVKKDIFTLNDEASLGMKENFIIYRHRKMVIVMNTYIGIKILFELFMHISIKRQK